MSGFDDPEFVDRWHHMTLEEQLGNIGSDVARVFLWRQRCHKGYEEKAIERSLQLLDCSLSDERWKGPKRREIARVREVLCDQFLRAGLYGGTPESLQRYFDFFALLARRRSGRG